MPTTELAPPEPVSPRVAKVKSVVEPEEGNTHVAEWMPKSQGGHYLGVSNLVKRDAPAYAKYIMQMDPSDNSRPFSGFKGNALCSAALTNVAYHEVQVSRPVDAGRFGDWATTGHMDGFDITHGITAYEGKSHDYDDEEDHLMARRQNWSYLGLMVESLLDGQTTFPLAQYAGGGSITLPRMQAAHHAMSDFYSVCVFMPAHSRTPSYIEDPVTPGQLQETVAWLRAKSASILTSIEACWGGLDAPETPPTDEQVAEALRVPGGAWEWHTGPHGQMERIQTGGPTPWSEIPSLDWQVVEEDAIVFERKRRLIKEADAIRTDRQAEVLAMLRQAPPDELGNAPTRFTTPSGLRLTVHGGWNGAKSPHLVVKGELPDED